MKTKVNLDKKCLEIKSKNNKLFIESGLKDSWSDFKTIVRSNKFRNYDVYIGQNIELPNDCTYLFSNLNSITFNNRLDGTPKNLNNMFSGTKSINGSLKNIPVYFADSCYNMFAFVEKIPEDIGESMFDEIKDISGLFSLCRARIDESIGNWDMRNFESLNSLFSNSKYIPKSICNWEVSKIYNIDYMFTLTNNIPEEIKEMNFSSVESMKYTFYNTLNLPGKIFRFNNSLVKDMSFCFANIREDVSNFIGDLNLNDEICITGIFGGSILNSMSRINLNIKQEKSLIELAIGLEEDSIKEIKEKLNTTFSEKDFKLLSKKFPDIKRFFEENKKLFGTDKVLDKTAYSRNNQNEYLELEYFDDCDYNLSTENLIEEWE